MMVRIMEKRSFLFYLIVLLLFAGLLFRCFWLSTGKNAEQSQMAVAGRNAEMILYRSKGIIYDRNIEAIAGGQPCWYLLVDPRGFLEENFNELYQISGLDRAQLRKKLKKETPFILMASESMNLPGIKAFEGTQRYSGIAAHLLGYLDGAGEVGLSGLEREYNDYLNLFASTKKVRYSIDAVRGMIVGLGIEDIENEESKNGVVLSLDKGLSVALERSMDRYVDAGAAIVMDCTTGELYASCSRPVFNEGEIEKYLNSSKGELINRAFGAQTVGSVFKIILTACALEAGMENFQHSCTGGIVVGGRTFACHNHSGHGSVGLSEAFAQSCNAYYIALGQLLGYEKIAEMAQRFGFGEPITVAGKMAASAGKIPQKGGSLALANLSIGQGALTASPLQIARMTAVIANGGILPEIEVYQGIYLNGNFKKVEQPEEDERILAEEHADRLLEYCVATVERGTGKNAKPQFGTAGGKTASAQTGIIENNEEKLNVYFTGFYPAENPKYVITVFAEGGASGGETCGPVFREMCDFIAQNDLTLRESVVY